MWSPEMKRSNMQDLVDSFMFLADVIEPGPRTGPELRGPETS